MSNMKDLFQRIGGRKFIFVMIVAIVSYLFVIHGNLTKEDFTSLVKMLVVAYPASTLAQVVMVKPGEESDEATRVDYRKFFFTVLIYALVCDLLFRGRIDSSQYMDLNQWVVGLYLTGNVLQKFADGLPGAASTLLTPKKT